MKAVFSVLLCGVLVLKTQAQLPVMNSYPSATAVVYLDFDGQYVQGTSWNWGGPINAMPSGLSSTVITEIFNRVAEDYRIFNLNITTDSAVYNAAPYNKRTRVIITPSYEWYGSAGGVAYVGSFNWGDDTPAWVFANLLQNNAKYVAEAVSHEAGHTLSLQHQSAYDATCIKTAEYATGLGSGEISWAAIMGYAYNKNNTTWHFGTSAAGCSIFQDDIAMIAGGNNAIGLRTDDVGNTHLTSTPVIPEGFGFTASGLINNSNDIDVFSFSVNGQFHVALTAVPQNVGNNNAGANADISLSLLNSLGDTIGKYNPSSLLSATVDTNLSTGIYYLAIEGVGNAYLNNYGSLGFYTVQANFNSILPINEIQVWGKSVHGQHILNWNAPDMYKSGLTEIESSVDGLAFVPSSRQSASIKQYSIAPSSTGVSYYRIRFQQEGIAPSRWSNIIYLDNTNPRDQSIQNTIGSFIMVQVDNNADYQLIDASGRIIQKGRLKKGMNRIETGNAKSGILFLRLQQNGKLETAKFIKQ